MHPRYFIGITLPDALTDIISGIQKDLFVGQKVMDPLVPHITLLHPNILMTVSPLYLIPRIKEIVSSELPITVELTKTNMFDERVLHTTVKSNELAGLQRKLVELLPDDIRARYEVGRTFTPHVTLAQAKPLQNLDPELIKEFKKRIDPKLPSKFGVKELTKFTWQGPRKYKLEKI